MSADAIGACPLCDQKMPLTEIADHIDAGCPQIAAAAPSPPRESRVLEDLRQGASCPLCMDVLGCVENNLAALLVDATPARWRMISTQVLDDPHCLPCAHAFCKDCIVSCARLKRRGPVTATSAPSVARRAASARSSRRRSFAHWWTLYEEQRPPRPRPRRRRTPRRPRTRTRRRSQCKLHRRPRRPHLRLPRRRRRWPQSRRPRHHL